MTCCGKVRYRDRIAAELALAKIQHQGHRQGKEEKRAYRCAGCRGWHLASNPSRSLVPQEWATA